MRVSEITFARRLFSARRAVLEAVDLIVKHRTSNYWQSSFPAFSFPSLFQKKCTSMYTSK
jgi:hypothetical protein